MDREKYREEIDRIDDLLLDLFAKRFSLVARIGEYKKTHNLPVIDTEREASVMKRLLGRAKGIGINEQLIKDIWQMIFRLSYDIEKK